MQNKFIVNHNDRDLGPFTEVQIKKMLASNQLYPTDYFFDDDKKDWVLLSERFDLLMQSSPQEIIDRPTQSNLSSFPQVPQNTDFEAVSMVEHEKPVVVASPISVSVAPAMTSHPTRTPVGTVSTKPTNPVSVSAPSKGKEPEKQVTGNSPVGTGKVLFSEGVGTISLKQIKSGKVSLKLKSTSGLDLPTELSLTIQSGPASQIRVKVAQECRAGEEISMELSALDAFENLASEFKGNFEVVLAGMKQETRLIEFKKGLATITFKPTVAETQFLHVKDPHKLRLTMPPSMELTVHPNVPVKLIAEAPQEVRAGEEIRLKITALDAYGNVVTDFKGEIDLSIESQVLDKAS